MYISKYHLTQAKWKNLLRLARALGVKIGRSTTRRVLVERVVVALYRPVGAGKKSAAR